MHAGRPVRRAARRRTVRPASRAFAPVPAPGARRHHLARLLSVVGGLVLAPGLALAGSADTAAAAATTAQTAGDLMALALWNANPNQAIHRAELRDTRTGRLLTDTFRMESWVPGAPGWIGFGVTYSPDNGLRVPERVSVTWWFDPEAAARNELASRQGPYVVALRSRISERVLRAAARAEAGDTLEIGIGAGVVPPVVRWHLVRRGSMRPSEILERGGDEINWRPTRWR